MRIRLMIGDREAIGLRLWESQPPPPANREPVEPDRNSMGMPSAERASSWVPSNRRGFGFGKPEV